MTRSRLYYLIWTVVFGVALAIGGSFLEIVRIPALNVTAATFWVAIIVTLNKLVLSQRTSVTRMYVVASLIAIFTPYLGPPSPLKPLLILAGLSFDVATRFKTADLKMLDLILGHLAITVSGFSLVWVIFRIHTPDLAPSLVPIFVAGGVAHFIVSVLVAMTLYKLIPPNDPPENVKQIRDQISEVTPKLAVNVYVEK